MSLKDFLKSGGDYQQVENSQRFYYMLQVMQSNRWKITLLVMFTFFFIVFGIVLSVMFKASIQENWKEMLLILLGAFVGNLNKVIDYWFSNEDRDKLMVQKMDEEDDSPGTQKFNILGEGKSSDKKPEVVPVAVVPNTPVTPVDVIEEEPNEDYNEEEPPLD
jgi:hypothetical protein